MLECSLRTSQGKPENHEIVNTGGYSLAGNILSSQAKLVPSRGIRQGF